LSGIADELCIAADELHSILVNPVRGVPVRDSRRWRISQSKNAFSLLQRRRVSSKMQH
jgi:hypothetical protein